MRNFLRWLVRSILNLIAKVEIHGYKNLPQLGAYVIATNHLGILDSAILVYALDRGDRYHRRPFAVGSAVPVCRV
jgi:1-acyl-sn-glycerol-3-phosphate acyltransferase